jgi:hypothetical protein
MQLGHGVPDRVSGPGRSLAPTEGIPRKWILAALVVVVVLAAPAAANATSVTSLKATTPTTSNAFWRWDRIDAISVDVSGFGDMHVAFDDNADEWATILGPNSVNVLGFMSFYYPTAFHRIFIGPRVYQAFVAYFTAGSTPTGNEYEFSIALMTLIHESFHWRLNSADESTVNACALKWFGYYLIRDFNIQQTIEQQGTEEVPVETTTEVPVVHVRIVQKRVKVNGEWVTRPKRITTTTYRTETTTSYETRVVVTTVPNPLYTLILTDAATFYAQQPPPYNAGTCSV